MKKFKAAVIVVKFILKILPIKKWNYKSVQNQSFTDDEGIGIKTLSPSITARSKRR